MFEVVERFLRYIKIDTQSDPDSDTVPSTLKQHQLAKLLFEELKDMGASEVHYDMAHCCVYAKIPATIGCEKRPTIGFIAHMDTAPSISGNNIKPHIIDYYNGTAIVLNQAKKIILNPEQYPEIKAYIGKQIITTDGTTLLGADDKAGIAEIMTMAHYLLTNSEIQHGRISIGFTPDEEIGRGTEFFDLKRFGADYAYTIDAGGLGSLEFETFYAASVEIEIYGVECHTCEAKHKMINACEIAMELHSLIPAEQKPEYTENREGFFHLQNMNGTVSIARLSYLICDFDRNNFEKRKDWLRQCSALINHKYVENIVTISLKDTYYNMREIIEPQYMFLIETAKKCMLELGIEPDISPIRGRTDGAILTFNGLPCPNLSNGGHYFHSPYEFCCSDSMNQIVKLLVRIGENIF